MFDRIVGRYDLSNNLMSFGRHGEWRRAAAALAEPRGARVLDLATGTGDLAIELARAGARQIVGLDFSAAMLDGARRKVRSLGLDSQITLAEADALSLPFVDQSFDRVSSAFLLRNLVDLPRGLREMHRVLRAGGRVVSLDITHPPEGWKALALGGYFRRIVPVLGGLVSGDWPAYQYLARSVEPFPDPEALSGLLQQAGFSSVSYRRLGLGMVALHVGHKESE